MALKTQMGRHHKRHVRRQQAVCQSLPIVFLQVQAKVRHGHELIAHMACQRGFERLTQVQ